MEFFHNRWTNKTQWRPPYTEENFKTPDFDRQTFVDLCQRNSILPKSPFVRLLEKEPEELWRESEVFLHEWRQEQKQIAKQKAEKEVSCRPSHRCHFLKSMGSPFPHEAHSFVFPCLATRPGCGEIGATKSPRI